MENKTEEQKNPQQKIEEIKTEKKSKMRQVIIEFNNNQLTFAKAEVASNWELQAILQNALKIITK